MDVTTKTLGILGFVPPILAMLFWFYHFYSRSVYNKYETMKRLKKWSDLPRSSAMEEKEETLNALIKMNKNKVSLSFKFAMMFTIIALLWMFYMH